MSARKPAANPGNDDLRQVIALLAEMCEEADERSLGRCRGRARPGVTARRLEAADAVRPFAAALARCVAAGDQAGADRLLAVQRSPLQWRRLALVLASAADIGRLTGITERSAA